MTTNLSKLIPALISFTKENHIFWDYLEDNDPLYDTAIDIVDLDYFDVDSDQSFFAKYKNGFFVILNTVEGIYLIALPTMDARINGPLNKPKDFQTELTRLTNLAVRQHPTIDDFIDDFLVDVAAKADLKNHQ